jgi:hypothetical protein
MGLLRHFVPRNDNAHEYVQDFPDRKNTASFVGHCEEARRSNLIIH